MSWQRIILSRSEYESGELNVLMGAFHAAYIARNGPEGMAMLGCWDDDQESFFVYLTPKSVRHIIPLLHAYSAKQIATPDACRLSLIYGEEPTRSYFEVGFEA